MGMVVLCPQKIRGQGYLFQKYICAIKNDNCGTEKSGSTREIPLLFILLSCVNFVNVNPFLEVK